MSNPKPWRSNKPWLLPKGLFDNSTSPITPDAANSSPTDPAPSPSSRVFVPRYHLTRQSKLSIFNFRTDLRPATNDHGMTRTHPETHSEDKHLRVGNEVRRRELTKANEQCHPAPWPMPPRRDYDFEEDAATPTSPTSPNEKTSPEHVASPVEETHLPGPRVLEIARRLMSENSFSQSDYQTPPESLAGNEEIEDDDNDSTESDLRIPRAVFDRIAKLYPPAPRPPTFPDFKNLFKSEDDPTSSSHSVAFENDKNSRISDDSESSASVVDVLQLFTDTGDGEASAVEEDGVLQPPSIDHVRMHRRQAPLPRGVGDKSFLNVNGLRSLFNDKHISASRTFSTLPSDSVTIARANALYTSDSPRKGGNFPRSRSELPRASTRIVPKSPMSPDGRGRPARVPNADGGESVKTKKKKKRKKRNPNSSRANSSSAVSQDPDNRIIQNTGRSESKPQTPPPRLSSKIAASSIVPDSPSMNLSPSSAAAASVPSSPRGPEVFNSTGRSKPEHVERENPLQNKPRTHSNLGKATVDRIGENEKGIKRVGVHGRGTGIFIRENMRRPPMDGVARAETGWIAGPGEVHGDGPPTAMQENPNPKSLAMFNVDDAVTQSTMLSGTRPLTRSNEFDDIASDSDNSLLEEPISRSLVNLSMQVCGGSAASSSSDGGNRMLSRAQERERDDGRSSQGTEEVPFKLVHRLRRALGVRVRTGDVVDMDTSDLTMVGTLDEAMVRICYVCRKVLDYRVDVRDGGRRIRVESKDAPSTKLCLRVTLVLTEVGDVDKKCTLKVLQSRSDANRTNIATLWDFYRKLEKHLRKVEDTGFVQNNSAGSGGPNRHSASTANTAGASDRGKPRGATGGNRKHSDNR